MEQKKVVLSITGAQCDKDDVLELITEGSYRRDGNTHVIEYEESALSGMEGSKMTITVSGPIMSMSRSGAYESYFVFEDGKFFNTRYKTVRGNVDIGLYPTLLDYCFKENEGRLDLKYQMNLGELHSLNQMSLNFKVKSV